MVLRDAEALKREGGLEGWRQGRPLLPLLLPAALFLACFIGAFLTIPHYGLVWDEPVYFKSAAAYGEWFARLSPARLRGPAIETYWYNPDDHHPPGGKLFMTFTGRWLRPWLGEVGAFRAASCLLYAGVVTAVFLFVRRHGSAPAGLLSALLLALLPRFFAHAHFATLDMPTTFLWFLCVAFYYEGLFRRGASLFFAVFLGWGLASRFSFVVLILAFGLFGPLIFRRRSLRNTACLVIVSPLVFLLLQPLFWSDPLGAVQWNLQVNLERVRFWGHNPVFYFGRAYWESYPLSYPFLMTLLTLPLATLVFFLAGSAHALLERPKSPLKLYLLFHGLLPLLLFVHPQTPRYDGVRLFLQVFPFVTSLAGLGVQAFSLALQKRLATPLGRVATGAAYALLCGASLWSLAQAHPYQLAYYGPLAGGVRGAARLGLETTYWGEVVGPEVLRALNESLPRNSRVLFAHFSQPVLHYYQQSGLLRPDLQVAAVSWLDPQAVGAADFVLMIHRQGLFTPVAWELYLKGSPLFRLEWSGVPLFSLYGRR